MGPLINRMISVVQSVKHLVEKYKQIEYPKRITKSPISYFLRPSFCYKMRPKGRVAKLMGKLRISGMYYCLRIHMHTHLKDSF